MSSADASDAHCTRCCFVHEPGRSCPHRSAVAATNAAGEDMPELQHGPVTAQSTQLAPGSTQFAPGSTQLAPGSTAMEGDALAPGSTQLAETAELAPCPAPDTVSSDDEPPVRPARRRRLSSIYDGDADFAVVVSPRSMVVNELETRDWAVPLDDFGRDFGAEFMWNLHGDKVVRLSDPSKSFAVKNIIVRGKMTRCVIIPDGPKVEVRHKQEPETTTPRAELAETETASASASTAELATNNSAHPHLQQALRELRPKEWAPKGKPAPPLDTLGPQ